MGGIGKREDRVAVVGTGFGFGSSTLLTATSSKGVPNAGLPNVGGPHVSPLDVAGFVAGTATDIELRARRVVLRPLTASDAGRYAELIERNGDRLSPTGVTDGTSGFDELLESLDLQRAVDHAHAFGVVVDGDLVGEVALEGVVRGRLQSAHVMAWIDQDHAGQQLAEEAYVALARHAFEDLGLHRIEAAVLTDNEAVKAALATVGVRSEGVAERYLEVGGVWRDHERFVLTAEEWADRRDDLTAAWLD